MHCQQQAEPGQMEAYLRPTAACFLSALHKRTAVTRMASPQSRIEPASCQMDDLSMLYVHVPRFDKFRPWLSVIPVKPHPPNPAPPNWLPEPFCVGDSLNSCGSSQYTVVAPSRSRLLGGTRVGLFQRIGLDARCILGE